MYPYLAYYGRSTRIRECSVNFKYVSGKKKSTATTEDFVGESTIHDTTAVVLYLVYF